jgi:hypothetical protein
VKGVNDEGERFDRLCEALEALCEVMHDHNQIELLKLQSQEARGQEVDDTENEPPTL